MHTILLSVALTYLKEGRYILLIGNELGTYCVFLSLSIHQTVSQEKPFKRGSEFWVPSLEDFVYFCSSFYICNADFFFPENSWILTQENTPWVVMIKQSNRQRMLLTPESLLSERGHCKSSEGKPEMIVGHSLHCPQVYTHMGHLTGGKGLASLSQLCHWIHH